MFLSGWPLACSPRDEKSFIHLTRGVHARDCFNRGFGDNQETFALIDSILDDFRQSVKAFQHHLAGAFSGSVDQKPDLSRN